VTVLLTGRANPERSTGREIVALTLRNLEDGRTLSTVTTDHGGLILPRDGEFRLEFTLEMNVPAGLYGLDTSVRVKERRGDIAAGPGAHLQGLKGLPFDGLVQTNARVTLSAGGQSAPAREHLPTGTHR
jgi:hypothetical protein